MGSLLEAEYEVKMTGCIIIIIACIRLGRVGTVTAVSSPGGSEAASAARSPGEGAVTAASQELVYLNTVIRAVPETQSMEIEADQRHVNMV
eukprot:5233857-Amphidinium_carterae.1